jgi:hypothetical protein
VVSDQDDDTDVTSPLFLPPVAPPPHALWLS